MNPLSIPVRIQLLQNLLDDPYDYMGVISGKILALANEYERQQSGQEPKPEASSSCPCAYGSKAKKSPRT